MEYRTLGRSGLVVSTYALGTMTFGAESSVEESNAQLSAYVDAGGTFLDLADAYAAGRSEQIVGEWLRTQPASVIDQLVVATKGRFPTGGGHNDRGLSRRHLRRALDDSLRRIGVEHVDLYQMHAWDPLTPVEEWLRFVDDAVAAGKVSYLGLSNFTGWQTQKTVDVADRHGWLRPVSMQPQYNLLAREIEWEVVPVCVEEGLGLLPWSPLGGGWLTGKYARSERPTGATRLGENPDRGVEAYDRRAGSERTWRVLDELRRIADDRGVAMGVVALAWLHDRPGVTSVILGARTPEQLHGNLAAADVHLTAEETAALDAASDPGVGDYPYGIPGIQQRSRDI